MGSQHRNETEEPNSEDEEPDDVESSEEVTNGHPTGEKRATANRAVDPPA